MIDFIDYMVPWLEVNPEQIYQFLGAILNHHFSSTDMCHIYTDTDRDVVVDALGPAIQVNKPVDSGQLGSEQLLPLGVDHGVNAADVIDGDDAVGGGAGICNERHE